MKVALVGVFPPLRSGIADYTVELAAALGARHQVQLYAEALEAVQTPSDLGVVRAARTLAERAREHDVIVYQVGNHRAHSFMYDLVRQVPGVVDLHDATLYDLTLGRFLGRPAAIARELVRNQGVVGLTCTLLRERRSGLGGRPLPLRGMRSVLTTHPARRQLFPLRRVIVGSARAVIVHSPYLEREVFEHEPHARIEHVPHGVRDDFPWVSRDDARAQLGFHDRGIPPDAFVCLSFGLIQRHKRIPEILEAMRGYPGLDEPLDVHYVLVGPRCPEYDLDADVTRFGLEGRVHVVDDFPPIDTVARWLRAADVGINLRGPSSGGMSGALLKMMALGLCTMVSESPEFAHLPRDAVRFVSGHGPEQSEIRHHLSRLASDRESRAAIGARAREAVRAGGFLWPDAALAYERALEATAA